VGGASGALAGYHPVDPIREEAVMNTIRRIRCSLAGLTRRTSFLLTDGVAASAGQPAASATRLERAPAAARPQPPGDQQRPAWLAGHPDRGHRAADHRVGDDGVPEAGRAAARIRRRRRNDLSTMTVPGVLPHTIQLCIHCRHNPAGFWVSRDNAQTVRRPWCLSCCQDLDPACHHIRPFDS
jgi:hypothetical protein